MEPEKVTIHFHSGSTAVATITQEDLDAENERLEAIGLEGAADVACAEELIETTLSHPPKPRWVWIGDVHCFTQAICGVECAGDTTKAN